MRIVHVASEVAPFAQSGGLADVVAGLSAALADSHGLDVAVFVPLYHGVAARVAAAGLRLVPSAPFPIDVGPHAITARLQTTRVGRVEYAFLDCPVLYDRAGTLYGPGGASEFPDNHIRFAALGKAALAHAGTIDVLHVHDWQGALAAIYAREAGLPVSIVATIHNLAYRGLFPKQTMSELGLPWSMFDLHHLEFWDQLCLLKGALAAADVVTTVSPTYAHEILTPERGEGLDAFLRTDVRRIVGIVNGIDALAWNPATDDALPARFGVRELAGKAVCRREIAREFDLALDDREPLIAAITRMTGQKGLDLVANVVPELSRLGAKLIVLGSGEPELEARFRWLADVFKDHVAVRIGFDVGLSRRLYAGSDLFVMPSRFEPCGLGQLYAMRYGSIPIVNPVGGLHDTVIDPGDAGLGRGLGTGIRLTAASTASLLGALERAVDLYRDPAALAATRASAMMRDWSWTASARQYVEVYRSITLVG
jgi:starch synthase